MHMFAKNTKYIEKGIDEIVEKIIEEKPQLEECLSNFRRKIETTDDVKRHLDFLEKLERSDEIWVTTGNYDIARGLFPKQIMIKGEWAENGFVESRMDYWTIGYVNSSDYLPHDKIWQK